MEFTKTFTLRGISLYQLLNISSLEEYIKKQYPEVVSAVPIEIQVGDFTIEYCGFGEWSLHGKVTKTSLEKILSKHTNILIWGNGLHMYINPQYNNSGEIVGYKIQLPTNLVGKSADNFLKFAGSIGIVTKEYTAEQGSISGICGDGAKKVCIRTSFNPQEIATLLIRATNEGYNVRLTINEQSYDLRKKLLRGITLEWIGITGDCTHNIYSMCAPILGRVYSNNSEVKVTCRVNTNKELNPIYHILYNAYNMLCGLLDKISKRIEEKKERDIRRACKAAEYAEKEARNSLGEDEIKEDEACIVVVTSKCVKEFKKVIK